MHAATRREEVAVEPEIKLHESKLLAQVREAHTALKLAKLVYVIRFQDNQPGKP